MGPIRMVVPQVAGGAEAATAAIAEVRFLDQAGRPVGRKRKVAVPRPPSSRPRQAAAASVTRPPTP